jgi:hypothetical protein
MYKIRAFSGEILNTMKNLLALEKQTIEIF